MEFWPASLSIGQSAGPLADVFWSVRVKSFCLASHASSWAHRTAEAEAAGCIGDCLDAVSLSNKPLWAAARDIYSHDGHTGPFATSQETRTVRWAVWACVTHTQTRSYINKRKTPKRFSLVVQPQHIWKWVHIKRIAFIPNENNFINWLPVTQIRKDNDDCCYRFGLKSKQWKYMGKCYQYYRVAVKSATFIWRRCITLATFNLWLFISWGLYILEWSAKKI